MILNQFFTEYDDTLTQTLNTDPLGMTMIWSRLGQDIFHNRVSSISNDVRNYTLNLIHHYVIKQVVESQAELSRGLQTIYGHTDTLAFKQASLIFLENVFVFSILQAEELQQINVQTQGILGASKARLQMSLGVPTQPLRFTKEQSGQLLVRQLTLGVSGRYKTPLNEMAFFDKEYRYHQPNSVHQWEKTQQFIQDNNELNHLVMDLVQLLQMIIKQDNKVPQTTWQDIPEKIKLGYAKHFATAAIVGKQSKAFWLSVTELDQNAAGSLYKSINSKRDEICSAKPFFELAIKLQSDQFEKQKLVDICQVEPLLAECELLFTLLMSQRVQSEQEVHQRYLDLDRKVSSIIQLARDLQQYTNIQEKFSGVARKRYDALLALGQLKDSDTQENMTALVEKLLKYHRAIMNQRGQSPWVERDTQGSYRCNIKLRTSERRPYKTWFHRYYLDQFSQLIRGLEGKASD
ncbi:hypothetical protein [Vibrio nigripulchritudo]|uniref:hypothetical protein n=1 Tax=Vibrio nigripulchritudo TaxID=28173 RepID=UPI0024930F9A|nr:hypothetical protein [Vibrio nigripulchritudo]BDU41087.1 hypothetical protein TUMSATVNIG2_55560 [Vibrio nigripulchritudo]BDU46828.1 hypothetical protein TUMSATVNIG3_56260 [Vibrio nigripulchritudo]